MEAINCSKTHTVLHPKRFKTSSTLLLTSNLTKSSTFNSFKNLNKAYSVTGYTTTWIMLNTFNIPLTWTYNNQMTLLNATSLLIQDQVHCTGPSLNKHNKEKNLKYTNPKGGTERK